MSLCFSLAIITLVLRSTTVVSSVAASTASKPASDARVDVVNTGHPVADLHTWVLSDYNVSQKDPDVSFLLKLRGSGLGGNTMVRFTSASGRRGSPCRPSTMWPKAFQLVSSSLASNLAELRATFPASLAASGLVLYLCLSRSSRDNSTHAWVHQGEDTSFSLRPTRFERSSGEVSISGFRAEGDRVYFMSGGVTSVPADQATVLRLMGDNFKGDRKILVSLTLSPRARGACCDDLPTAAVFAVEPENVLADDVMVITVDLPELETGEYFYFCVKDGSKSGRTSWVHQGDEPWLRIYAEGRLIPKWIQVWLIVLLQIMSGLFSGLNLGLMSLDKTELKIIGKCGTDREKEHARIIAPLRSRGNYLLCSIVMGNVLVNSLLTVLLDDLTSGLVAVIGSTIGIVIFGEIIPQAICSRHGLAVGAMTAWITKFFMLLTFPLSYPVSRILDCCLGEEIGNVYDRERLMEYIKVVEHYKKLEKEEVNMISGALELKTKTARDIMTPVEDVYMISLDACLDFETVAEILRQGYTRVPVYESYRDNVVALLHTKDLALIDPDDNTPVKSLCQFYNHPIIFIFEEEKLNTLLDEFKKGKSHLACVRSVHSTPDEDPRYVVEGIVTLEDVIEEIIQSEIMDETDRLTDNRRKQSRKGAQILKDFSDFVKIGSGKSIISPQLALAVFQFLATSLDAFRKPHLSESVLRRLLTQNIFFALKQRATPCSQHANCLGDPSRSVVTLYKVGKPADYFLLVLEGKVKVTVGKEKLMYEAGPFTYFGLPAIVQPLPPGEMTFLSSTPRCNHHNHPGHSSVGHTSIQSASLLQVPGASPTLSGSLSFPASLSPFVPDYTVVAASDVVYMKVHKAVYAAALKATLLERQHRSDTSIEDCFQECRRSESSPGLGVKQQLPLQPKEDLQESGEQSASSQYLLTTGSASISAFNIAS